MIQTTITIYFAAQISIVAQVLTSTPTIIPFDINDISPNRIGWNQFEESHLAHGINLDSKTTSISSITNVTTEAAPEGELLTSGPLLENNTLLTTITTLSQLSSSTAIQVDFGNTAPGVTGWNQFAESDLGSGLTAGNVVDSTGAVTNVTINLTSSGGGSPSDDTVFGDGSAQGGSNIANIYEDGLTLTGNGNDEFIITISGLDPLLNYNIFAGALSSDDSFGAEWSISTITQQTAFQDTQPFVDFSSIAPDSSGTIVIVVTDINNGNSNNNPGTGIGISELTLTVVPEPSSSFLLCLGALGFILRRSRTTSN